ncbi:hypothetical protein [Halogeometricum luteum]|uniref:DUF8106 domain-containing protein n=1 Tax=Halogeometricum luteum TaxID=2950537 RepID=A0ABU2G2W5_9EURY|nr:hypothetical protein [Halogeometricum sp. S3BR5-2]MDS0294518.1 hypothetical protein [Halogeometricum sp. S3BR5-2]
MNALTPRSPPERQMSTLRKSVLFCPDCDRAAPLDDWSHGVEADAGDETVSCPDCEASLAVVRIA